MTGPAWNPGQGSPQAGTIEVLEPGLLTTVQDLGRYGFQRHGFSPSGAADPAALILGNRLVGNDPGAAALEITILGPRLRFTAETAIALTGADLGAVLDGEPVPVGVTVRVPPGGELAFRGGRRGCRSYLCVAGGIDVPQLLGSRSTDLWAGIGGYRGRPLRAGDRLPLGPAGRPAAALAGRSVQWTFVPDEIVLRVVPGPQWEWFPAEAVERFFGSVYHVRPDSDRSGVRLEGPAIARKARELLSEGQTLGAIQIPPDGRPIVLMAGRATVGGYPKLGIVITPDIGWLAQARPGDRVRFERIELDEALELYRQWWRTLHRMPIAPGEGG
ncbi:MAG TPA: biotin-dependent carboxyltransferase family protein [Bacillota bacterium]